MPLVATIFERIQEVSEALGADGQTRSIQTVPAEKSRQPSSCLGANDDTMRQKFPVQASAEAQFYSRNHSLMRSAGSKRATLPNPYFRGKTL
jgi:hypothetical protein